MKREVLLKFTRKKVEKFFEDFPAPAHGIDHILRVTKWAVQIARREGQDEFLAELAAILHDVGRVPEQKIAPSPQPSPAGGEGGRVRHQELSYLLAKEWFEKDKEFDILTSREKEEILYAARYHWDDTAEKYPLANILRDADKLDMYGNIGVERACAYHKDYKARRKNIEDNLASAARLKTKTAKEIVKKNKLLKPLEKFLENNMKVLIIGAKGMLGQELAREFSESDYEVLAWDREEIDITKKDLVLSEIKVVKPEIIINAAAYNAVDKIEEGDGALAEAVNGYAVGNLAEAAEAMDAILVHYSTDYVFDGDPPHPSPLPQGERGLEYEWGYKEDDTPNPQSVYAKSKWIGEQMLINPNFQFSIFPPEADPPWADNFQTNLKSKTQNPKPKIHNPKYYLIRTSRLFGKPAASEGAKKSFVDAMLKLADEKDCLELVDEEVSSPTYVRDLARRTREIIEWKKPFGIYHATNFGACTWHGWAKKIFELSGKSVKLIPVGVDKFPRPAKRPKYSALLNTKLPPMRSWESALEEYLKVLGIKSQV